jgi:hypothetical protein
MNLGNGLSGAKALIKALREMEKKTPSAVARALYQQGMQVHAEAVKRAPVEFSVLRSSAYVAPPTKDAEGTSVEVGFGTVYAARQHEETEWKHPRGGEAKYLEKAVASTVGLEKVAAFARKNVEQGLGVNALPAGPPRKPVVKAGAKRRAKARREKRRQALRARRKKT